MAGLLFRRMYGWCLCERGARLYRRRQGTAGSPGATVPPPAPFIWPPPPPSDHSAVNTAPMTSSVHSPSDVTAGPVASAAGNQSSLAPRGMVGVSWMCVGLQRRVLKPMRHHYDLFSVVLSNGILISAQFRSVLGYIWR